MGVKCVRFSRREKSWGNSGRENRNRERERKKSRSRWHVMQRRDFVGWNHSQVFLLLLTVLILSSSLSLAFSSTFLLPSFPSSVLSLSLSLFFLLHFHPHFHAIDGFVSQPELYWRSFIHRSSSSHSHFHSLLFLPSFLLDLSLSLSLSLISFCFLPLWILSSCSISLIRFSLFSLSIFLPHTSPLFMLFFLFVSSPILSPNPTFM